MSLRDGEDECGRWRGGETEYLGAMGKKGRSRGQGARSLGVMYKKEGTLWRIIWKGGKKDKLEETWEWRGGRKRLPMSGVKKTRVDRVAKAEEKQGKGIKSKHG